MQSVAVNLLVQRSAADCWSQLSDLSVAHYYVPGLTGTEIVSGRAQGEGTHRQVYSGTRCMDETVTDWQEGSGFTLRLHRGDRPLAPFQHAEFVYALAPAGDKQARITLEMRVVMPGRALGSVFGRLLRPVLRRQLRLIGAGMKHFYETGEAASDADRKRLAGAVNDGPGVA